MLFADRVDAGRSLAKALLPFKGTDVVVLGLPRGGVPVAAEVARQLGAPLDVLVVRKLGVPYQPELGMGAIGEDGVRVLNEDIVRMAQVTETELAGIEKRERTEVERRARAFRGDGEPLELAGRTVLVVDDGVATGSTARAACRIARARGAARVVLAVPVGPAGVENRMRPDADEVVCLHSPADFMAVGQFYRHFQQVADEQVLEIMRDARQRMPVPAQATSRLLTVDPQPHDEDIDIQIGPVRLAGHLTVPEQASSLVIFAHGSGSSRHSPRNRHVATALNGIGLGTLLFDLLTVDEESSRANIFDIDLLAHRLVDVTAWTQAYAVTSSLRIGYFGASTGAAAALVAAAAPDSPVGAVVSRGGRPDLAAHRLTLVRAATLLIVGGRDELVLDLNRAAQAQLRCESRLEIVPHATHLFEEPGALDSVARLAGEWFKRYLVPATVPAG